ncbi:MAG: 7-carboxy-7-deazaguanine synthase QueE [Candidatus Omnitrophota bacterium]
MEAKISEIFTSHQGEGPFAGSRQLFVRFYGCNLNCVYCDTDLTSYKTFSPEGLLGKILDFEEDYNELSVTGGEPLLYADFLRVFLPMFKKYNDKKKVYLETNGTLPKEFLKIKDLIDIVAMDIKLPSSDRNTKDHWAEHEEFIKLLSKEETIIKAVITDSTTIDDIKEMGRILSCLDKSAAVVLQPVTPGEGSQGEADEEMLSFFKRYLEKEVGRQTSVIGQIHKCLGIR